MEKDESKKILTKLKDGLLKAEPRLTVNDFGSKIYRERNYKEFYLLDDKNNFFDKPNGDTKLGTGTRAVKSSAAFIFNIFGNDEIKIAGKEYNPIKYEKQLKALKNRNPANLDGFLLSKDNSNALFFETKLLEWSGSPKNLSISYLDEKCYPKENDKAKDFISFFTSLVNERILVDKNGDKRRQHITKVYDAIQMTIHILGIYNAICRKESCLSKKIDLINLVWNYDCERYKQEENEANKYIKLFNDDFAKIFKEKGIDFSVKYFSFSEFMKITEFKNLKRKEYLEKRYFIS